jgi:poly-gamma-glutamate synthesis protein (capsule biosynthesis protein)
MKKIVLLIALLVLPLIFFSFLARPSVRRSDSIQLFYDRELEHHQLISRDIATTLRTLGYRVHVNGFDADEASSYLFTNPCALYLTDRQIESNLFALQKIDYVDVKVPIARHSDGLEGIASEALYELNMTNGGYPDSEIVTRVLKNRSDLGIVSLKHLCLDVRPVAVDGVFPTIGAIRSEQYPWIIRASLYLRRSAAPELHHDLLRASGGWFEGAFTLIAGGDIMLARGTGRLLRQFGPRYPFEKIRNEIEKHDIAFANLESPISSRGTRFSPNKGIYFRAEPSVLEGLQYGGFDVVSLGNNHMLDWGGVALRDTMAYLERGGLAYSGAGETWEESFKPAVLQRNGTSVAIISINDIYPFELRDEGTGTMKVLSYDKNRLGMEIKKLAEKYDILVASVHAGVEYVSDPETEKVEMMRSLIDSGIDVVLGSHPHVIQGIEVYGDGLIAYSLGNLIFDQSWSRATSLGLLLELGFLSGRPIYYYPRIVHINNAQPALVDNADARSIISSLSVAPRSFAYAEN